MGVPFQKGEKTAEPANLAMQGLQVQLVCCISNASRHSTRAVQRQASDRLAAGVCCTCNNVFSVPACKQHATGYGFEAHVGLPSSRFPSLARSATNCLVPCRVVSHIIMVPGHCIKHCSPTTGSTMLTCMLHLLGSPSSCRFPLGILAMCFT